MGWLSDLVRGGRDELGWDDLIRRTIDAVAGLARHGARGEHVFPASAIVRVEVAGGGVAVVEELVRRAELDREVEAGLVNRLDVERGALPLRDYVVVAGERTAVTATEGAARRWRVTIEGGDRDGEVELLPESFTELAFGRGEWHGGDQQRRNDLVVCRATEFVSRRAGRLHRAGHQLEVTALDQGDALAVRGAGGEPVRPARTARGRVVVRPGDALELGDGGGHGDGRVVLRLDCPAIEP